MPASCLRSTVAHFGVDRSKIHVILNPVNTEHAELAIRQRDELRRQLGITDRYVVCYCGSLREWQRYDEGIRLFTMLRKVYPMAFFLGITQTPGKLRELIRAVGVEPGDGTVVSASHTEVARYLAASDLGLITRGFGQSARLADRVSCPVKFSEYLASGTPVVLGSEIGDCSRITLAENIGVVIGDGPIDENAVLKVTAFMRNYKNDASAIRARCRSTAERLLSLQTQAEAIGLVYDVLAEPLSSCGTQQNVDWVTRGAV